MNTGPKMMMTMAGLVLLAGAAWVFHAAASGDELTTARGSQLYIDVHELGAGQVTARDVAEAHEKDLAVEETYGTHFLSYWVDESRGRVYCLSEAPAPDAVVDTHREAHGLVPAAVHAVSEGERADVTGTGRLFLDVHRLEPGSVTADAVAAAHEKDLAVQGAHDVNFISYWLDEVAGMIWCLSEAPSADAVVSTHRDAHGLVPDETMEVIQGE
jgi:hypothetical protein